MTPRPNWQPYAVGRLRRRCGSCGAHGRFAPYWGSAMAMIVLVTDGLVSQVQPLAILGQSETFLGRASFLGKAREPLDPGRRHTSGGKRFRRQRASLNVVRDAISGLRLTRRTKVCDVFVADRSDPPSWGWDDVRRRLAETESHRRHRRHPPAAPSRPIPATVGRALGREPCAGCARPPSGITT